MLVYWLMYLFPFTFALMIRPAHQKRLVLWFFLSFIFILLIGLRHEVGGDWFNYLKHFERIPFESWWEILTDEDPGYYLLNKLMYEWGWGIYGVNLINALLFFTGLVRLSRQQYNPWLAMSVAIPYLVIVVGMGYTRQATAIGLVMWSIALLQEKRFFLFLILVVLAATFHKSAVVMVGIGMFGQERGRLLKIIAVGFVGAGIYAAFLAEHQEQLVSAYVEANMQSQGAMIRVAMNFVPALLFFMLRKPWKYYYSDYAFWRILALGSLAALFMVGGASTAVDRMALYMIPLQIVVFGRLPALLGHRVSPKLVTTLVLLYYMLVLFVWLNFAAHSGYWLPYQNLIWLDLF